jgi:hypothetical protein
MNSKLLIDNSNSFKEISDLITFRFQYLKKYLIETSELIEKKLEDESKEIDKTIGEKNKERSVFFQLILSFLEMASYMPNFIDKEKYPKYFNNSSFLFVFSIFESHITQIGKASQKLSKSKLGYRDIHAQSDIDKVKTYLEKYLEIDLSEFDTTWSKIKDFQKIRNRIAHNQSSLEAIQEKDLRWYNEYLKKDNRFSFDEETLSFHIKNTSYLIDFCDESQTYILGILSKLSEKFD